MMKSIFECLYKRKKHTMLFDIFLLYFWDMWTNNRELVKNFKYSQPISTNKDTKNGKRIAVKSFENMKT